MRLLLCWEGQRALEEIEEGGLAGTSSTNDENIVGGRIFTTSNSSRGVDGGNGGVCIGISAAWGEEWSVPDALC